MSRLRYSVSATTRAPRTGEEEGKHYFFLDRAAFEERAQNGGFIETREYEGNLYGMPRDYVQKMLTEGYDVIMKPEVNGAMKIKAAYPDAVLIFLVPDKFSNLRERLLARRTETNEEIAARLETAHREMKFIRDFDYIVINEQGRSDDAMRDLQAILQAERFRIHRWGDDSLNHFEQN